MHRLKLTGLGMRRTLVLGLCSLGLSACTSGTKWVRAPLTLENDHDDIRLMEGKAQHDGRGDSHPPNSSSTRPSAINPPPGPLKSSEYADSQGARPDLKLQGPKRKLAKGPVDGRLLGIFRNTYYDFPAEASFDGPPANLMNRSCQTIAKVPRGFFEALCVQGSGTLITGQTVSFSKRDCSCAEVCPRTGQKICFDRLDQSIFPWGRGARGTAITPLSTVAVDSDVIPLGTKLYILEYDGVPRSRGGARHDGCFIAEDRGMKVVGKHIDLFTGNPSVTKLFNENVPSNLGVHVYLDTARCE